MTGSHALDHSARLPLIEITARTHSTSSASDCPKLTHWFPVTLGVGCCAGRQGATLPACKSARLQVPRLAAHPGEPMARPPTVQVCQHVAPSRKDEHAGTALRVRVGPTREGFHTWRSLRPRWASTGIVVTPHGAWTATWSHPLQETRRCWDQCDTSAGSPGCWTDAITSSG